MPTTVTRRYHFESAHFLPHVPEGHKCFRVHGHNYLMDVTMAGNLNSTGFIIDFWDLDKIVQPIIDEVDHRTLNAVKGLENPTAERIASWFFIRLKPCNNDQKWISHIRIFETRDCWADYHND